LQIPSSHEQQHTHSLTASIAPAVGNSKESAAPAPYDFRQSTDSAPIAPGFWGRWCGLDLAGCDPSTITDTLLIARYIEELCRLLEFRRYGDPVIVRFGDRPEIAGFSFTQLIETSLVSGHLVDASRCAFIDIFSCAPYSISLAEEFTRTYFGPTKVICHTVDRLGTPSDE